MAQDENIVLTRWKTPCSDLPFLDYVKLVETTSDGLFFTVTDKGFLYEFHFSTFGPYQMADEAFLECYHLSKEEYDVTRNNSIPSVGRTCLVKNSNWANSFEQVLMREIYFKEELQQYHIGTESSCLDILATQPPTITIKSVR